MPCRSPGRACCPGRTADAILDLDLATDFDDFREAARSFAVPAQNLLYADRQGHIGYQAPGQVPIRRPALPRSPGGVLAGPGLGLDLRLAGLRRVLRAAVGARPRRRRDRRREPGRHPQRDPVPHHRVGPGLALDPDRRAARRAATRSSPADMADIQLDTQDSFAKVLVPALLAVPLEASEADPDSASCSTSPARPASCCARGTSPRPTGDGESGAAAAYYNAVWRNLLELLFDDELPAGLKADGDARWRSAVQRLLTNPKSAWWDNKLTPNVTEGKDEVLRQALVEARLELTRELGKDPDQVAVGQAAPAHPRAPGARRRHRARARCAGWSTRARSRCRAARRSSTPTAGTRRGVRGRLGAVDADGRRPVRTSTRRRGSTRPG